MTTTTLPHTGASGSPGSSASAASARPVGGELRFASVGARLGAVVIDVIAGALGLVLLTLLFLLGAGQSPVISAASALVCVVLARGASLAVSGWSLGGRAAGVRLVSASTRRPSALGVFLRADITLIVMLPTLGLGGIALLRSVAADPQKRGWHDRTSGMMAIATRAKGRAASPQAEHQGRKAHRPAQEQAQGRDRDGSRDSARRPAVDAATAPRGRGPGASRHSAPSGPRPSPRPSPRPVAEQSADSAADSATESWTASSEHSWPRVTPLTTDPARAWHSEQPPASRTPEEPGRRAAGRGEEETASSWDSPTRPGKIGANPVTSQPMDARPAKEQPWQPRPEQAASPAAPPEAAEPQASRGPIPPRESLFAADRSFTASSSRHSDVAHTFDTASVLPAADRSTQALIDSVPWSSVPTSLDSTTMDSLPDQIRSAMQHDEQARGHGAAHSEFADTESLTPISASSPASPAGRHRSVNLLDPQEVPSAHGAGPRSSSAPEAPGGATPALGSAAPAEAPDLPRSISPGARPAPGASPLASPSPAGTGATPATPAASAWSGAGLHAAPTPHTASTGSSPVSASATASSAASASAASASRASSRSSHAASPAGSAASPASAPATPSPYAASPASHLAPPSSISAPYGGSRAARSAASASSAASAPQPASPAAPYAASHAAPTSHSASSAPARPHSHRAAQHRAPDAETPDSGAQDAQDRGSRAPRRPVPPTVEVPRVSRRRRASARSHQAPAAMPPTMPRPNTANPPLSVRLIPMTGGDPLIIHEPTVVGRDPDNISDYPGAERISLSDPTRSVSKTHAAIFPLLDGVWVTDLHSTNGTRVEGKDGSSLPATPEEPLAAMDGSTIFFGRIGFRVEVI
ncbi:RDD family protein [Actinomyces capricornis]|uniref:FHA domain-containing protein n=1 Tax=Actinomyces capricornis TaxID=2755559 RepID=A0ABN6K7A7_9ACTO|nr:RDD family protein [Actinomyces capricornis]BDA63954.1 hypothetical protein MANAM107_07880 [Actinomyces capricornis]